MTVKEELDNILTSINETTDDIVHHFADVRPSEYKDGTVRDHAWEDVLLWQLNDLNIRAINIWTKTHVIFTTTSECYVAFSTLPLNPTDNYEAKSIGF